MGIFAVVLGILAVVCAAFATFLFGTAGGIFAAVLGVGAVVLGVLKRRKTGKGGMIGVVIDTLAVILAISLTNTWSAMFSELHKKAVENKPDGLWAQSSEDTNSGMMGIINKLPKDEASLNAFIEEMNELSNPTEKQE